MTKEICEISASSWFYYKADKRICIYILLHEPKFSIVTALAILLSRVGIHYLSNMNFDVFCEVFLKARKFCQAYDNFVEQTVIFG
jgi:hypothetical protein